VRVAAIVLCAIFISADATTEPTAVELASPVSETPPSSPRLTLRLGLPRVATEEARRRGRDDLPAAPRARARIVIGMRARATEPAWPEPERWQSPLAPLLERGHLVRTDDDLRDRLAFDLRAGIELRPFAQVRFEAAYGLAWRGSRGGGADQLMATLGGAAVSDEILLRHGPWLAVRVDF
jgi:hypothetical protein